MMKWPSTEPNLLLAWLWILAGSVSGSLLGLRFHRENWLGGYTSFKRRMYRLGHISFFGLGMANLAFHLTWNSRPGMSSGLLPWASGAFIVGALSMPPCCVATAHAPRWRALFGLPVGSLLAGASLTLLMVISS